MQEVSQMVILFGIIICVGFNIKHKLFLKRKEFYIFLSLFLSTFLPPPQIILTLISFLKKEKLTKRLLHIYMYISA